MTLKSTCILHCDNETSNIEAKSKESIGSSMFIITPPCWSSTALSNPVAHLPLTSSSNKAEEADQYALGKRKLFL